VNQVEICNLALGWLAAKPITSIDDDTTEAKLCKASWTASRDTLLEAREWSFAVQRFGPLPASTEAPAFYWTKKFQIPTTVLRVLRCVDAAGEQVDWQREGQFVVCDQVVLYMVALVRVEDAASWSPSFAYALSARLAADLCMSVNENGARRDQFLQLAEMALKRAATQDAMQGRALQITGPDLTGPRGG
jgi:hypothetical protein